MTALDDTAAWRAFEQLINARSSIRGYLQLVERPPG